MLHVVLCCSTFKFFVHSNILYWCVECDESMVTHLNFQPHTGSTFSLCFAR